jgi:hypothetical protein
MSASEVRIVRSSSRAWAMRMRSKGSHARPQDVAVLQLEDGDAEDGDLVKERLDRRAEQGYPTSGGFVG